MAKIKVKDIPENIQVAVYIRVSTQEQTENYSIDIQRERVEAYCKSKGWSVRQVFVDGGFSGASMQRPALQDLLSNLDKFDTVVVYKLDRLSRSQRDTMELIQDYFLENGLDFASVTETLDTTTTFGMAMIGILAVFAELERGNIAERMRGGLIKRTEEGYRTSGGNHDPSGYVRKEDGDLEPLPKEVEHIQKLFNYYEQFLSITKAQKKLKEEGYPLWRFTRCRQILLNHLYIGEVSFAGVYYEGRHEAIVTKEQFDRVQTLLSRHRGHNAHKSKQSLLSGLMTCGCCGEIYVTYSSNDTTKTGPIKRRYYICRARRLPAEYKEKCLNKTWNYYHLEEIIMNEINNLETKQEVLEGQMKKTNFRLLIRRTDEKIEKLLDLYTENSIDKNVLDKRIKKIGEEKEELIYQENLIKFQEESQISFEELKNYKLSINKMDFETKHAMVQKLIKSIIIDNDTVKIEWNF